MSNEKHTTTAGKKKIFRENTSIDIIAVDFGIVGGMSLIVLSQTSKTLRLPHSYEKVERIRNRN